MIRDHGNLPSYVAFSDLLKAPTISGVDTFLLGCGLDGALIGRLQHHKQIRTALRQLQKGHHLELLAAAIMNERCNYGEATKGSGDQGIDAIGWRELLMIEPSFCGGAIASAPLPGEQVFLFASSKALMKWSKKNRLPKLLNPAHIRELVGGWIIQRSSVGAWQNVGIRMLTPVQMVLVTTYRLSIDAKAECVSLGIQIWGMSELIYLICRSAPDSVFDSQAAYAFRPAAFRAWWKLREVKRMAA